MDVISGVFIIQIIVMHVLQFFKLYNTGTAFDARDSLHLFYMPGSISSQACLFAGVVIQKSRYARIFLYLFNYKYIRFQPLISIVNILV